MCVCFFSCWYIFDYFFRFFLTKNFKYSGNIQLFGDTFTNNLDFFLSFISSFSSLRFVSFFFSIVFIRHHRNKIKKNVTWTAAWFLLLLLFFLAVLFQKTQYGWWRERKRKRESRNQMSSRNTNTNTTTTTKREWIENSYLNLLY